MLRETQGAAHSDFVAEAVEPYRHIHTFRHSSDSCRLDTPSGYPWLMGGDQAPLPCLWMGLTWTVAPGLTWSDEWIRPVVPGLLSWVHQGRGEPQLSGRTQPWVHQNQRGKPKTQGRSSVALCGPSLVPHRWHDGPARLGFPVRESNVAEVRGDWETQAAPRELGEHSFINTGGPRGIVSQRLSTRLWLGRVL